jgi:leader peptidase (prepilin peptidase)/N-methyltransferase
VRYLLIELLVLGLGLVCYGFLGLTLDALMMFVFFWVMILVFFIDLEFYIIPDVLTGGLALVGVVWSVSQGHFVDSLWGCLCGAGIYFSLGFVSRLIYKRETMGLGDVKLGAAIGLFWGLKVAVLTVYLSFMIGGVGGLFLILFGIKKRTDIIPFGPAT